MPEARPSHEVIRRRLAPEHACPAPELPLAQDGGEQGVDRHLQPPVFVPFFRFEVAIMRRPERRQVLELDALASACTGGGPPHAARPHEDPGLLVEAPAARPWDLGLRHRRVHDTGRTFISLARGDGAWKDVLRLATHKSKEDDGRLHVDGVGADLRGRPEAEDRAAQRTDCRRVPAVVLH